jgi:lysophospholipase L1-like esterase
MSSSRRSAPGRVGILAAQGLVASVIATAVAISPASAVGTDPALRAKCSGTSTIRCHYDYSPGNYEVTVRLGDATSAGVTSVTAEARRVMLGTRSTPLGQQKSYTFDVNVRQPEGQPTGQGGTGTPGLDLVFGGSAPKLYAIGIAPAKPRALYLIGDSTVCDQPAAPYTGWGQELPQYFAVGLSVANYADSGESSGSFLANSALWPTVRPLITPNDYVFIQLGHNDKTVTKSAYQSNLTALVTGVKARGGTPVLVTPPVRRWFTNNNTGSQLDSTGLLVNGQGVDLPAAMREVARAQNTALIDLTARSKVLVEGLGPVASGKIYLTKATDGVDDRTHFSSYGANEMAKLVIQGAQAANLTGVTSFLR